MMKSVTLAALIGFSATAASAITVTQTQILTSNGQNMTFNFIGIGPTDAAGAILTIASGIATTGPAAFDGLDLDANDEGFVLSFDGVGQGTYSCGVEGTSIPGATGGSDCDFSLPITVSQAAFAAFAADSLFSVGIDFLSAVNHFGEGDEVIVSLSYEPAAVPLPASALLLVAGLGGIAAMRRTKT